MKVEVDGEEGTRHNERASGRLKARAGMRAGEHIISGLVHHVVATRDGAERAAEGHGVHVALGGGVHAVEGDLGGVGGVGEGSEGVSE